MNTNNTPKENLMEYVLSLTPEQVDKIIKNLPLLQRIIAEKN